MASAPLWCRRFRPCLAVERIAPAERRTTEATNQSPVRELTTAELGIYAEDLAVQMLRRHGVRVVARNVRVGEGELDIVAMLERERIVVEVRSVREEPSPGRVDPLDAFDQAKACQVRRLAGSIGCSRVDLVAIRFWRRGVDLHWLPFVS
jgi:Holliday junction resolvase-like predicted endonuclease